MKKVLKVIGILLVSLILLVGIGFWWINEAEPEGNQIAEADQLAQQMMQAVNKPAWDTTHYLQWTFKGMHHFVWDKQRNYTQVRWEDKTVLVDLNKVSGKAFQNGTAITGAENDALVTKAWEYFCNDSFWLNAVVKAFDPGTTRTLVTLPDGRKGLKVAYSQGGVTPGDRYVWILDEAGRPQAWKMWVNIIPFGGLEFSWEDWTTLATGAQIATLHKSWLLDLDMTNLKGGTQAKDIGLDEDIFAALLR